MKINRQILKAPQKGKSAGTGPDIAMPPDTGYDNYYSRLVKLIPAEVIAFYLALDALVAALPEQQIMLWVAFGITLIGAWFYLGRVANVTSLVQRLLSIVALVIWVYVTGGPFAGLPWYNIAYGKVVLVVFTFFVPVLYLGEES
jgi:uncharacterized membrane protein YccC